MKHFDFLVAAFAWRRLQTPTSPLYNLDFRRRIPVHPVSLLSRIVGLLNDQSA